MNPKVAVIYLPGNNCEKETLLAVQRTGVEAEIVRWNQKDSIDSFHGYVVVGGWAYEDRIRAGAVAAKDPIIKKIAEQSKSGKPILGICNGAQVLIESGLVPNVTDKIEMALAPNINPQVNGYYCTWIHVQSQQDKGTCAFNKMLSKNQVIPMPIAHGEGRFMTSDIHLVQELERNRQIILKYCTPAGEIIDEFPFNPNGSSACIAGLSNKAGNVMAMMPHPERGSFHYQLHDSAEKREVGTSWQGYQKPTKSLDLFTSMKRYIEERVI